MHDTIEPNDDDGVSSQTPPEATPPVPGYVGDAKPTDYFYYHEETRSLYMVPCCFTHAQSMGVTAQHTLGAAMFAATYANPKTKPIPWQ